MPRTPADEPRVSCATPTPGKQPVNIPKWKYDAVRRAILDTLPIEEPGVAFTDLPKRVAATISADERSRLGSVSWHATTVKLDLEVKGEIRRVRGATPQRLVRCDDCA